MLWSLASIVAIIFLPIWVSAVYVVSVIVWYVWWSRRFNRRRLEELADGNDLLRPGQATRTPDRPSGGVHGRHSWSRRD